MKDDETMFKKPGFNLFLELLHTDKPEFDKTIYKKLFMSYGLKELDGTPWSPLSNVLASTIGPVCLDVEALAIDPRAVGEVVAQQNRDKIANILDQIHQARPDMRVGYYGLFPQTNYYSDVDPIGAAAWRHVTDLSLANNGPGVKMDISMPSLYLVDEMTKEQIKTFFIAMLTESRRYQKSVIPFLGFDVYNSNNFSWRRKVTYDEMKYMLEIVYYYYDSAIIWGGYQEHWSEDAPWWVAVKDFAKANSISAEVSKPTSVSHLSILKPSA